MTSAIVVRIMAERIMQGGVNPKSGNVYTIDDITNAEYRQAVNDYIAENTPQLQM